MLCVLRGNVLQSLGLNGVSDKCSSPRLGLREGSSPRKETLHLYDARGQTESLVLLFHLLLYDHPLFPCWGPTCHVKNCLCGKSGSTVARGVGPVYVLLDTGQTLLLPQDCTETRFPCFLSEDSPQSYRVKGVESQLACGRRSLPTSAGGGGPSLRQRWFPGRALRDGRRVPTTSLTVLTVAHWLDVASSLKHDTLSAVQAGPEELGSVCARHEDKETCEEEEEEAHISNTLNPTKPQIYLLRSHPPCCRHN
ncbi:hypothetical protein EYF80_001992 [Liparis tanakae]|uniref:Uncharacterized protein n=1 Tax=Liparis tanakae TaxID=230148 RepID=A0A4Z2JBE0_9TELE|nr:hypothetical protein EYF80_001992 [Liparis tanakae]